MRFLHRAEEKAVHPGAGRHRKGSVLPHRHPGRERHLGRHDGKIRVAGKEGRYLLFIFGRVENEEQVE